MGRLGVGGALGSSLRLVCAYSKAAGTLDTRVLKESLGDKMLKSSEMARIWGLCYRRDHADLMTDVERAAVILELADEVPGLLRELEGMGSHLEVSSENAANWKKDYEDALLQIEKLRAKVDQLTRFTECFVAHPYEGTLECDVAKPCPFCRYQYMVLQIREYQAALRKVDHCCNCLKTFKRFEKLERGTSEEKCDDCRQELTNCVCIKNQG